jgi:metal-responsive CopG/Arc/MetJ family transcriptional regulator
MSSNVIKLTVSLPAELIKATDKIAKDKKLTRSKLVAMCLKKLAEEHVQAEMIEGYKAMAEENRQIATLAKKRQSEILPEW